MYCYLPNNVLKYGYGFNIVHIYTRQLTIATKVCAFCEASGEFPAWRRCTCEGCVWLSGRDWINSCRSCNGGNSPGSVMGFPSSRWKMLLGRIRGGWLSKLSRILAKTKKILLPSGTDNLSEHSRHHLSPLYIGLPLIMNHPLLKG